MMAESPHTVANASRHRRLGRRQFLKGGLSAASLLTLSACAASAAPAPTAQAAATAQPPAALATVKKIGSKIKVTYWESFSGQLGKAEKAVVEKCNALQSEKKA